MPIKAGVLLGGCGGMDICMDEANRLVTTPCYINDVGPWTVFQGAEKMVAEALRITGKV